MPSDSQLSKSETVMLKSSPSQGQNVGGMDVPTTLDSDHEDLGKSTHHQGQDDIFKDFEDQKKDGTEENNLVAQQGNQVRYIDISGKATQSKEGPEQCLEGKNQDKASTSLNSKVKTFAIPNTEMKKLCEESIRGTNQPECVEKMTKNNSTKRDGRPQRHSEKSDFPTYDDQKGKSKQSSKEPEVNNNKADEMVRRFKKHQNQDVKTQFGFKRLLYLGAIFLFSIFPVAQCLDGEWHVYRFCVEEGLSGKNLSIKIGIRNICELTGARSPCNVTCDEESEAYRLSDICTALITRCANNGMYLERGEAKSVPSSYSETFSDRKNATKYVLSNVTPNTTGAPNPNDITPGTNTTLEIFLWFFAALLVNLPAFALGWFIQWRKKKRWSSELSSPEEGVELNNKQNTDGSPNGINGHAAHNGISSLSSVVVEK